MVLSAQKTRTYKDLIVYQKAFNNSIDLFRYYKEQKLIWSETFLIRQLLRASTSVGANIVEGYGRNSRKDYRRFLSIAKGSALETEYWINAMVEVRIQDKDILIKVLETNIELIKMLTAMIAKMSN